jgi:hypothetical protein
VSNLNLAPWAQFLPIAARITGRAESDLSIDEPLAAGVPHRLSGSVAVTDLSVRDEGREAIAARRIEASGLEVHWPTRVAAQRVVVTGPRGVVERDRSGELSLRRLWAVPGSPDASPGEPRARRDGPETGPAVAETRGDARAGDVDHSRALAARPGAPGETGNSSRAVSAGGIILAVGEIAVRGGALSWRDAAVMPPAALDFAAIDASVTGVTWPPSGPVNGRIAARPPGGGRVEAQGRIGIDPIAGDVRIRTQDADLSPYRPYLPTEARVNGWADVDLAVHLPQAEDDRLTARGTAAVSRVDVRDQQRSILRLERGVATDLDVVWPERVTVRALALRRPWVLVERDEKSAFTLRSLLLPNGPAQRGAVAKGTASTRPGDSGKAPEGTAGSAAQPRGSAVDANGGARLAVTVHRLVVEEGGARIVDRSLAPHFAVDMSRLAVKAEGLATAPPARPARITVSGRIGADSLLDLEGTIGPLDGPLRVDLNGAVRGFWLPRTDPYLLRFVGWEARDGFLTTAVRCRIDGDDLDAEADIRLSRLVVAKASGDEAQKRIGLPLGLIVSLMKDPRGDIHLSLPVGGRLDDPRFDYSEAIWSTLRNATIKAITLPVSWIGRVTFTPDSRIERIEVDPVRFAAGTASLTAEGQAQVSRLGQFLSEAPESRMRLTPAVSPGDLAAIKRRVLEPEIERAARSAGVSREAAARRLFQQRFPDRTPPGGSDAVMTALMEATSIPADAAAELAAQRVEAVRAMARKAGIREDRLPDAPPVTGPDAPESQVALAVADPGTSARPSRGLPDLLRRLGPSAGAEPGRARGRG